jgi:alginate O-acetyltransferase complex protein AlgI
MLFNSEQYLLFLPIAVALTWVTPPRLRPLTLLALSYYFYAAWNASFLVLIIGLSAANFVLGLVQGRRAVRSRLVLAAAVVLDLGALAVFKYLGLLDQTATTLAHILGVPASLGAVRLLLPLGLSFFTFEFIHYQVDVYRGSAPITNPVRFFLFPAFFPTQIAGPIKRYQDFDKQVRSHPRFSAALCLEGCELIARGLFKKVVLADGFLVPFVTAVFAKPEAATPFDVWGMLIAFALQIYFDFSGYTDIGRGSAQLLGYTVPENFDAPYLATSIREFWRRWHMSLSNWLRDYLYIPLGGSRKGARRTQLNLIITMALGGLWHGAAWHFMLWGLGQGAALAVNRSWETARRPLPSLCVPAAIGTLLAWFATQLVVLFLWGMFRTPDVHTLLVLWSRMAHPTLARNLISGQQLLVIAVLAASLLAVQLVTRRWNPREAIGSHLSSIVLRPAYAFTLLTLAFVAGASGHGAQRFIYFQF